MYDGLMRGILLAFAAAVIASLSSFATQAQDAWPSKPVRFIVPSSPGGGTDLYARILAQALGESLKQQFIVDNRPGASGNVGAAVAAKSPPDGYTFLISANPALTVNPSLYRNLPYNAERDFTAVTRGVIGPLVLIVHPSLQVNSVAELVALGRSEPGRIAFGSAGTGSPTFLGIRMLEELTGARFIHVPYKGVGPAYQDLLGGQIKFMFPDLASSIVHVRAGKLRALAVSLATPALPGVPTLAEAGFPLEVLSSFSVVAPTGTPAAVVQRLNSEIGRAMRIPAVAEKLETQALVPVFDTPDEFAATLKRERERWAQFIRRNGIAADE
jgi:tripartite-type tricarboxylate transporter receptor subunit TctC